MSDTRVRLPDGSYVTVPTSDPKAAAAAARKHWDQKQASAREPSVWQNAQDTFIDNVLPNWGDEIAGFGRGLGYKLFGKGTFSEGFQKGRKEFQASQKRFKTEHPVVATTAAGAGMGAGMVLPAGNAGRGLSLAQRTRQAAQVGAIYGAASGAGEGEGLDLGRRGANAASGAAKGAVTGAMLPVVGAGVQRGGRLARQYVPGADAIARTLPKVPRAIIQAATGRRQARPISAGAAEANRVAARRMNEGNISMGPGLSGPQASPEAIQAEVASRNAIGVPAMIGDVTPGTHSLLRTASNGMGPGQTLVRERLAARKTAEAARVRQHVLDTMPTVQDPIAFVEQQRRSAREAVAPLYAQAYAQPMYRTEAIQAIEQTPAFNDALPQAYRNISNQLDDATGRPKSTTAMGFRDMTDLDPNGLPPSGPYFLHPSGKGYVTMEDGLTVEGYDQVARAMQDMGRAAGDRNPVTGKIENTTNSVHINARANDLRSHLRNQNAAYDQAVGRYGGDMAYSQAFDHGRDIGALTGHEVNAIGRSTPEAAHEAFATGAGTALADEATRYGARNPNGDTANRVRQMIGDDTKQQALGEIGGNTGGIRDLLNRLEYERQGNATWQTANRNGSRQGLEADLGGSGGLPMSKAGAVSRLVEFIVARSTPQYRQDLQHRLAEIVTASDARSVGDVMQAIGEQAQRDQRFADMLHRSGVGTAAVYGSNVAPTDEVNWEGGR